MKTYKLILLKEDKNLGSISLENNYQSVRLELEPSNQHEYQNLFESIVMNINLKGNFNARFDNSIITNSSKDFWVAFVQTLLLNLNILVKENE